MSGVDVTTYTQLQQAEALLYDIDSQNQLGRFKHGSEQSVRLGSGNEIDGLRDYTPGDDVRMIDWRRTAQRHDNGLFIRQHYADQAPLTVLVSDIPTYERYAGTPGNPLSAQALGFVAVKTLLQKLSYDRAQVLGYWTNGTYDQSGKSTIIYSGADIVRGVLQNGLQLAVESANRANTPLESAKKGFLKKFKNTQEYNQHQPETENFCEAIKRAASFALLSADVARYIVLSDFRNGTDEIIESLQQVKGFGNTELITLQITNPLLRELPSSTEVFNGTSKKGIIVESQAQRDAYKQKAALKQAKINQNLHEISDRTIIIDTSAPTKAFEA